MLAPSSVFWIDRKLEDAPSTLRTRPNRCEDRMDDKDTAEDGRRENEKDRLIEELREAVRAREEFVSIAAHELRNPMTPILVQVHRLLANAAKNRSLPRRKSWGRKSDSSNARSTRFVRRATALLDVSRIAAGNVRIESNRGRTSRELCRGWWTARRRRPGWLGVASTADLQGGVVGMWDPLAVEQVVENLLSNALKFGAGQARRASLCARMGETARLADSGSRYRYFRGGPCPHFSALRAGRGATRARRVRRGAVVGQSAGGGHGRHDRHREHAGRGGDLHWLSCPWDASRGADP